MITRRFSGFFWTQFLGAFNDNVYKNAIIIYITFQAQQINSLNPNTLINLGAGLFILPFFLFSSISGQLSDKFEKSLLIRRIKIAEILIMALVYIGFMTNSLSFLFCILFLMGTQSTFFSPVKYSIIPQHLSEEELIGGNALVEMGTFAAILIGTMTGGILIQSSNGKIVLCLAVFLFAVSGWLTSLTIPEAQPAEPTLDIKWNPITQTIKTILYAKKDPTIWKCVWAISWFWFLGGAYLTQIPNFTRTCLGGDESVATMCLTIFSLGIGLGSMFCEKLSNHKVDIGLSVLGAFGLFLFGADLAFAYKSKSNEILSLTQFINTDGSFRVIIDFLLISTFGGFYIVPLYAFIQQKTPFKTRSRVIAANNIINAFLMVLSSVTGIIVLGLLNFSIPIFFLVLSVLNIIFFSFLFVYEPLFIKSFKAWIKKEKI